MLTGQLKYPIIVVSYGDDSREALTKSLNSLDVEVLSCATFCEAEEQARINTYNGILVDLPSIVKAKGEEKVVACSLASFYPTLRVRTIGTALVPMAMPGDAKQDGSLGDFLSKSCAAFVPRKLRSHRRRDICISTLILSDGAAQRSFTQNISWGGAFIVDMHPEKYTVDDQFTVRLIELEVEVQVVVRWVQQWGHRRAPGVGVMFCGVDEKVESAFAALFRNTRESDRDRLIA